MTESTAEKVRWTAADVELLPDNGTRYEIIDGELFRTRAPHWQHQLVCSRIVSALGSWSETNGLGQATMNPGVLFSEADNVIPDVVWISNERLSSLMDTGGHLNGAPELVVEVFSPGIEQERRDREVKLKLYSTRGVREYWIVDWRAKQVEVYRRERLQLALAATLIGDDGLTSPLLPGFACTVARFFL